MGLAREWETGATESCRFLNRFGKSVQAAAKPEPHVSNVAHARFATAASSRRVAAASRARSRPGKRE